jgi:hypothetical protein
MVEITEQAQGDIDSINANIGLINQIWGANLSTRVRENLRGSWARTVTLEILKAGIETGFGIMIVPWYHGGNIFQIYQSDNGISRAYRNTTSVCCQVFAAIVEQSLGGSPSDHWDDPED